LFQTVVEIKEKLSKIIYKDATEIQLYNGDTYLDNNTPIPTGVTRLMYKEVERNDDKILKVTTRTCRLPKFFQVSGQRLVGELKNDISDNCNNWASKSIIDINRSGNKNSCCSDARNGESRQMNSKSIKAIDCFLNEASKIDKKSNGKSEKAACKSRICVSCEYCSNKSKYRSLKARLHVSIKSKKVADKCEGSPIYDSNECDSSNVKIKHNGSNPIYKEVLRSSILQFFLNQMKNIVLTRELQFDPLKMISERLIEDKKNAELLMLMDLIIKIQVSKVKEIIFQDLLNEEIIPVTFARVFLKQYKFLKTLSHTYSDILKDYETSFLFLHDLSFDLINRAHFKIHLYDDCKDIQNLIDVGHFNVEAGQIFDAQKPDKDNKRTSAEIQQGG